MKNKNPHPEFDALDPTKAFQWAFQAANSRDWTEAVYRWAVIREAFPERPAPWLQGAIANTKLGRKKQAEHLLEQARQRFPRNPNFLVPSAELAILKEDWGSAEDFLEQAREASPDIIHCWLKSAELAELRGKIDQAEMYLKEAQDRFPDRMEPLSEYAELAMRSEQWEEALLQWALFRDRFPGKAIGYLRAAEAARKLNQLKEARRLTLANQYGSDLLTDAEQYTISSTTKQARSCTRQLAELIWAKAIFNLRSEVHRNYLSYGWWVLEPLLHMIVYYVVFGLLLNRGEHNYPVFLLTGLVPWMWFMKSVSGGSNSILAGQNLMLQVGLPSVVFPLIILVQSTLKQIPVFLLLIAFVWTQGYQPGYSWFSLLPVIIVQALFTVAVTCFVAAIIPFVRDLSYLVPTGLTFFMFLSGIFYDYKSIAPDWQEVFLLNPMAFLLKCYREILSKDTLPDYFTLSLWGTGSAVACFLLILAYNRLRYVYPRIVLA